MPLADVVLGPKSAVAAVALSLSLSLGLTSPHAEEPESDPQMRHPVYWFLLSAIPSAFLLATPTVITRMRMRMARGFWVMAGAIVVGGVVLLVGAIGFLGTSPTLASVLSVLIAVTLGLWAALQRILAWRRGRQSG